MELAVGTWTSITFTSSRQRWTAEHFDGAESQLLTCSLEGREGLHRLSQREH